MLLPAPALPELSKSFREPLRASSAHLPKAPRLQTEPETMSSEKSGCPHLGDMLEPPQQPHSQCACPISLRDSRR